MERRRRNIAILLLTIFLSAWLASALHRHPERVLDRPECVACLSHAPHSGHITSSDTVSHCVLCHFLGLPYVATFAIVSLVLAALLEVNPDNFHKPFTAAIKRHLNPRAPPVSGLILSF